MQIIPSILVNDYQELERQIKKVDEADGVFDYAQLDIMDGIFVNNKSFDYTQTDIDINKFFNNKIKTPLKYELHLMTKRPLKDIKKWRGVKNVFRIIFHIEAADDPKKCITQIKNNNWQTGICLNPDTALGALEPYYNQIDVALFMTVVPGRQGAPFMPEMENKVRAFTKLKNRPKAALDGGINLTNITQIKTWGADIACVGSALMNTKNIGVAYNQLVNIY